jgi:hypothetical protein
MLVLPQLTFNPRVLHSAHRDLGLARFFGVSFLSVNSRLAIY